MTVIFHAASRFVINRTQLINLMKIASFVIQIQRFPIKIYMLCSTFHFLEYNSTLISPRIVFFDFSLVIISARLIVLKKDVCTILNLTLNHDRWTVEIYMNHSKVFHKLSPFICHDTVSVSVEIWFELFFVEIWFELSTSQFSTGNEYERALNFDIFSDIIITNEVWRKLFFSCNQKFWVVIQYDWPMKCLHLLIPTKQTSNSEQTCQICGGYRLMPCPSCSGSKKSVHRNHFTTEFVALKCMNCDEVGLVKCYNCNDW